MYICIIYIICYIYNIVNIISSSKKIYIICYVLKNLGVMKIGSRNIYKKDSPVRYIFLMKRRLKNVCFNHEVFLVVLLSFFLFYTKSSY